MKLTDIYQAFTKGESAASNNVKTDGNTLWSNDTVIAYYDKKQDLFVFPKVSGIFAKHQRDAKATIWPADIRVPVGYLGNFTSEIWVGGTRYWVSKPNKMALPTIKEALKAFNSVTRKAYNERF